MNKNFKKKLRQEVSENTSGKILNLGKIKILKESDYCIVPFNLDGDAPKRFIKAYFYENRSGVYKSKFKTWNSYIAKSAEKWYPHESVIEFLLNRIGEVLELKMNQIKLSRINGQIRFLSHYFLDPRNQKLVHGAEICGEYLQDENFAKEIAEDKKTARELFTIQFIIEAINSVFNTYCKGIILELIKMIVYDSIVGNNDRHFYNWGVIKSVRKNDIQPTFSPIYDSARGLLWNWSDDRVKKQLKNLLSGGKKVENYIQNASPRISIEGDSEINHFGLIDYILANYEEYRGTIFDLISLEKERIVVDLYKTEFKQYFIDERNQLVTYIIQERFKRLRKSAQKYDQKII